MRSALLALATTFVLAVSLSACASTPPAEPSSSAETQPTADAGQPSCTYLPAGDAAKENVAPPETPTVSGQVEATLETSSGSLTLTLDADAAPCAVNSFVSRAEQGYFDNTECHRLTTEGIFVLQCGDPSATGRGGPGYSFADELTGTETYEAGTLAMANAGPNTNGSQFFLVYQSAPGALAPSYTDFGTFDDASLAIVEEIAAAGTASDGVAPATPVEIAGVTISR